MIRHSRIRIRNARERYIAKRRKQFARWCGGVDYEVGSHLAKSGYYACNAPRPLEVRTAEYWDGRVLGRLSKWNGVCSCWMCRARKTRQDRTAAKAELRRLRMEAA